MQRKMFVVFFFLLQRLPLIANSTCNLRLRVHSQSKRRSTIAASIAMPVAISVSRPGEQRADNESEALTCND